MGVQPNDQDSVGELQWDYTATQQAFLKTASSSDIPTDSITWISEQAEAPSLELIYRTMVHNHEQAQKESRKAKIANRQLQSSIKKVVKSSQDISIRIASMETRTEALETEVKATTAQTAAQGPQISDIQWKLEDAENRQRRNNLRILGIAEGLAGQDTRFYDLSVHHWAHGSRQCLGYWAFLCASGAAKFFNLYHSRAQDAGLWFLCIARGGLRLDVRVFASSSRRFCDGG
ncbi:hypothetical protein NDU88_003284 [Pleurodeles waltl]|uniref:Uncharacterized protein n=1 Tax=Pleurodeles waltl TaxID=8319 RepID=A0AAV7QCI5_PLEWA|nr:hypothetical protein NDU88_003284 [Pleurodeles waltl]